MTSVSIRPAKPGDEKILAHIQVESWKSAFEEILSKEDLVRYTDLAKAEAMYRHVLEQGAHQISIETIDGQPHAIAAWGPDREGSNPRTAELICIHSLPGNWHKGYGAQLMDHVLDQMRESGYSDVVLWVFEQNIRARKFYEKLGFCACEPTRLNFGAMERLYRKIL